MDTSTLLLVIGAVLLLIVVIFIIDAIVSMFKKNKALKNAAEEETRRSEAREIELNQKAHDLEVARVAFEAEQEARRQALQRSDAQEKRKPSTQKELRRLGRTVREEYLYGHAS